jgi:hypothetical protein
MSVDLLVTFRTITCCQANCGITFAVPDWWMKNRRTDHSFWYCPHGHSQHFTRESDADKAGRFEKKYHEEQERTRLARVDAIEERTKKERLKRKLSRVHRGVCPSCNRSFQNVRRHMESKHKSRRK